MKPLVWVGSSLEDLRAFPEEVRRAMGYALYLAQMGDKHPDAKPREGFGGAGGLEAIEGFAGDSYPVVCTVKLPDAVYVLHAFQQKAKRGIATPKRDLDTIRLRLRRAQQHAATQKGQSG
jgi:phage-related protein